MPNRIYRPVVEAVGKELMAMQGNPQFLDLGKKRQGVVEKEMGGRFLRKS